MISIDTLEIATIGRVFKHGKVIALNVDGVTVDIEPYYFSAATATLVSAPDEILDPKPQPDQEWSQQKHQHPCECHIPDRSGVVERDIPEISHAALIYHAYKAHGRPDRTTGEIEDPDRDFVRAMRGVHAEIARDVVQLIENLDVAFRSFGGFRIKRLTASELAGGLDQSMDRWQDAFARAAEPHIKQRVQRAGVEAIDKLPVDVGFNGDTDRINGYAREASRKLGSTATQTFREQIEKEVKEGMLAGDSIEDITMRIQTIPGSDFSESQARVIARTETATAQTQGSIEGWRQSGVVSGKQFLLAPDACEICQAVAEQYGDGREGSASVPVDLDEPLYKRGDQLVVEVDGRERTFSFDYADVDGPPIHPQCRCALIPVLEAA